MSDNEFNKSDMQVLGILKYLFREYCDQKNLSTEEMPTVTPPEFISWVMDNFYPLPEAVVAEFKESDIDDEAIDLINQVFRDQFRAHTVMTRIWPAIVLSGRTPVKHQPIEMELELRVRYPDGRVAELAAGMPLDGTPMTDGLAGALVRAGMMDLLKLFCHEGLDNLYEVSRPENKVFPDPT